MWKVDHVSPTLKSYAEGPSLKVLCIMVSTTIVRVRGRWVIPLYRYIYGEMLDFGGSDKMIKIREKVGKSNTTVLVVIFRPLFTEELLQTKHFLSSSTF